jgi:FAD:protein FMN transferase
MAIASDSIRRARPLLGTFVEIEVAGAAKSDKNAAIDAAFDAISLVHRLMSFHEPESDVSRFNREARVRPTQVHAWTFQVLEAAIEMHRRSSGVFDVAVAPALQAMGLLPSGIRCDGADDRSDVPIRTQIASGIPRIGPSSSARRWRSRSR